MEETERKKKKKKTRESELEKKRESDGDFFLPKKVGVLETFFFFFENQECGE